jgi:hypothetical protein
VQLKDNQPKAAAAAEKELAENPAFFFAPSRSQATAASTNIKSAAPA